MKDHDLRQGAGGVIRIVGEAGAVDDTHHGGRGVADAGRCAVISEEYDVSLLRAHSIRSLEDATYGRLGSVTQ